MIARAVRQRIARRDDQGFALLTLALLKMTWGQRELAGDLAVGHQRLRAADSALSDVVQTIRTASGPDLAAPCPGSSGSGPYTYTLVEELRDGDEIDVVVTCVPITSTTAERVIELSAVVAGSSASAGRARIEYADRIGSLASPGYTMTICDWRLGASSTALAACP